MYYKGDGIKIIKKLFIGLKAAQQEIPDAQLNLALMYYHGDGINQDKKAALDWFESG